MSENTGFAAYALWNALKLHFTSESYDYFKYKGKMKISDESFLKRRDRFFFAKLERKYKKSELIFT
jgi:hypothetical protein